MGVIAVIAALPREVAGFVRGFRPVETDKKDGVYTYVLPGCVVVCAGMGGVRATLAVQRAIKLGDVSMLVSAGLAGGCHPGATRGSVIEAGVVVDSMTGERFAAQHKGGKVLVTTHTIASVKEKERLFASYEADVVDMEASTVARLAGLRGLPFRAIKAVSDGHQFELSSLSRFASPHGHFRSGAFALHTALRPTQWKKALQLGAASQKALAALSESLKAL